ncbi:MAG: maleylacetate reductase [Pseudomonadota bacterium]
MSQAAPFVFPGISTRVVFGSGTLANVGEELARLGHAHALLLSTPHQSDEATRLAQTLGPVAAGVFAEATMHTPVAVTDKAVSVFQASGATAVIALGGGSTIGLGKAIATRTGADQICVPTSYAGSEMTDILGETEGGVKTTRRDASIRPETVIYDVDLTLGLPLPMTMTSALNAIAHAAEALYAADRNPVVVAMAERAFPVFRDALPRLASAPRDADARAETLYAAWLCSTALGYVAMGLHHKLCHTIGGAANTPHADTHAIMLPHTIGFNAAAVPDLLAPIDAAFGASPGKALFRLAADIGAPTRLADLGVRETQLDAVADLAVRNPYDNPRPFDRAAIRAILQDAWAGNEPGI